jgi:hypothetical protein
MEKVQARIITPMRIFNDKKHRGLRREVDKKIRQNREKPPFLLFRIEA